MATQPVQTLENHVRQDWKITVVLVLNVTALITAIVGLAMDSTRVSASALIVASIGGALGALMARQYALSVQDRVIQIEMRLRLAQILPDDMKRRIGEFTLGQLIALRFAPDAELPALAKKVLDEKIEKKIDIKKLIKDWQADWHRV